MCFSAASSFGAAVFIGGTGLAALQKANTNVQRNFALIPIFFSLQQFTEGLIWVNLSNAEGLSHIWGIIITPVLTYLFLFFAWVIWPIFIPFSMRFLEQHPFRKKLLNGIIVLGIAVTSVLVYILLNNKILAELAGNHIRYEHGFSHPLVWVFGIFYFIPVVFSCFVSSIKRMWYLGVINMASYLYSKLFFTRVVISVWCFFAAVSSIFVLVIIYDMQKRGAEKLSPLPH
jgi:hypothetical protein